MAAGERAHWLTPEADARISAAIAAVEAQTSGEIVCTCTVQRHVHADWLLPLAMALALALPLLAVLLNAAGWLPFPAALAALSGAGAVLAFAFTQLLLLLAFTALAMLTPIGTRLTPLSIRQARAHDIALRQFLARGIHLTTARTGVLIHLSLADHVAEVIADARIYEKVPPDHWGDTVAALLQGAKRGDPVQGFVDAIALAGKVLAANFPPAGASRNQLPNRLNII